MGVFATAVLLLAHDLPPGRFIAFLVAFGVFQGSFAAFCDSVLAIYAEQDARVNANRPAMTAALENAKLAHQILTVPGVDHAFFNDTGPRYNKTQAEAVYKTLLEWFDVHLR